MFGYLKNLLLNEGINIATGNEYLPRVAGAVPVSECQYELWVSNDLQYDDARTIIQNVLSDDTPTGPQWVCRNCGEENESQFTLCWNCGREIKR
jgi:hypothetical protein